MSVLTVLVLNFACEQAAEVHKTYALGKDQKVNRTSEELTITISALESQVSMASLAVYSSVIELLLLTVHTVSRRVILLI